MQVTFKLLVAVVVVTFDRGFLDRAVHPLDLPVGPGRLDLGKPVLDGQFAASPGKEVLKGVFVPLSVFTRAIFEGHLRDICRDEGG